MNDNQRTPGNGVANPSFPIKALAQRFQRSVIPKSNLNRTLP